MLACHAANALQGPKRQGHFGHSKAAQVRQGGNGSKACPVHKGAAAHVQLLQSGQACQCRHASVCHAIAVTDVEGGEPCKGGLGSSPPLCGGWAVG